MSLPKLYTVTFSTEGIASVVVGLDATPVQIPSGYGGWTVLSRQRRTGLTVWQGKDPLRMTVPVLFDGFDIGKVLETDISRLSRMALPPVDGGEPPVVKVSGTGLPKPGPTLWVIESLAWGTNIIRDFGSNGVHGRLRQDCVVNLLEYRADDAISFKSLQPGKVHNVGGTSGKVSGWPKTWTVRQGDTLAKIAALPEIYGDASKWRLIANANNIRDPSNPPVGKRLKIPAPN